ncbi:hypothetical protein PoB_002379800 [Plakobranchus ocellatus]|uniref:Uncharacterized protein n=1 Tax=Plakobranchus ocellatus TaxID=259542 RepID=A0AAV3ZR29_9GAST|nr:hypothetical protein PoB_002379800 [Plakobranchus ocellatus]
MKRRVVKSEERFFRLVRSVEEYEKSGADKLPLETDADKLPLETDADKLPLETDATILTTIIYHRQQQQ